MADVASPACKGNPNMNEHPLIELGPCSHNVGGAIYGYEEYGCPDCGVTARKQVMWACGTRGKAIKPTADNCAALKWKTERTEAAP